ncbi:PKD domain-containing protein [Taibaiella soli]|nr:PKD domain-containing protein [Taibaiella soli]
MNIFTRKLLLVTLAVFFCCLSAWGQTANFTANNVTGCAPLVVQFTSTSTGTNASTTYNWNLGNSVTSVLQNPSTTYSTAGTYTVTLTVSNGGSSNTKTITNYITVKPSPAVNFTASPLAACPGSTIQFTNTSALNATGNGTFLWNFGDGQTSNLENPSHYFPNPGFYNITLQVTNSAGCTKTKVDSGYIHIYDPPTVDFTGNTNLCNPPAATTITATATGANPYTYSWTYGDGGSGSGNPTTHTYTTNGNYDVKVIVTDGHGCKDTVSKTAFMHVSTVQASFTGPTSICVKDTAHFTNTSNPLSGTAYWDFGDGTTSTNLDGNHAYTTAGTYTVKMIAYSGSCTDSITHTITVRPSPTPNFTFAPQLACPAPATISFTNTSGGGNGYTWSFGDGGSSTATSPTHTYTNNYVFPVTLIVSSSFGCKDSVTKDVGIYDLFVDIYASKTSGCAPLPVDFKPFPKTHTVPPLYNSTTTYPGTAVSYTWDFGDGTGTSTQTMPSHTYQSPGVYLVKVTVVTANGCTHTDSMAIEAGPHPTANFTATPTTTCLHDPVHFTNLSQNATSFEWVFGDGGVSTLPSLDYPFSLPGIWDVKLYAYNNGCADSLVMPALITALAPKAMPAMLYSCDTALAVNFADNSLGDSTWIWKFGDGTSSTVKNPSHVYPALGTYTGQLITHNTTTGCSDTAQFTVTLINPQPDFKALDTAICKDDTAFFQALNVQDMGGFGWTVTPTATFLDTLPNFKYKYQDTGIYKITLIAKDAHSCVHTVTKTAYMHVSKPYVNFGATPPVGCTPMIAQFKDSTRDIAGTYFTNWIWSFGDNTSATLTTSGNTNHTYYNAGAYDIKLTVTDNVGCTDSFTRLAYIEARHPHASFTASKTGPCIGEIISFYNNSTSPTTLSSSWDFGDNTTSNATNPTHAYASTGVFTVRLIVTDPTGCKDTFTRTNYISITKPHAAFSMSDSLAICPPLNVQFTNNSTNAIAFNWDFGNGGSSQVANPANFFNNSGQYTVMLVAIDGQGCRDTARDSVRVLGYAGALTYTPLTGCMPLTVQFTASIANVPSLIWDFSDGVTASATGTTATHTYTTMGAFVPKLIISDGNGCLTSSTGLDTIKVDGVIANFTYQHPACVHSPVTLQDSSYSPFSAINGWMWAFNDGQTGGGQTTMHTYDTVGTYPVTLIAINSQGCRDTIEKNVTVIGLPTISAGLDTVICVGDAATLQPDGGVSYTWESSPTLSCTNCTNPQANPTTPTSYIVIGTGSNGCKNTDTVMVSLKTKTVAATGPDGEICNGAFYMLQAIGGQRYQWSPAASLDNSTSKTPKASPTTNTKYMLISWEGSCIPDTDYVNIVVHPKPIVDAGSDQQIVAGNTAVLHGNGSGIRQYVWSPEETLSCDSCANPTASPKLTTTYTLLGYTDFGCVDSDVVTIHILCDQSQVFVPNSFTPNGDGHNDYFYPRGKGLDKVKSFRVFNRWGEMVYERTSFDLNDKTTGWDGTFKGQQLHADVFVYMIEGVCDNGESISWKGDVTLIR